MPTHGSLTKAGKVRNQVVRDLGFGSPYDMYHAFEERRRKRRKRKNFPRIRYRQNFKKRIVQEEW